MNLKSMGLVLVVNVFLAGCATWSRPGVAPAGDVHLFLLAGQSNMAGRGELTPDRREAITGVYALQADGSWGPAVDPLHWDKPIAGVGLARSFAQAYRATYPGVAVGFIPAACGGSSVEQWVPGAYYEATQSHPYDDALARVAAAREHGTLKGVLWHQGESDAQPERAGWYAQRLADVFARFRRDLGDPELPILVGQLGRFEGRPWDSSRVAVDTAHQRLAATDARTAFVSSVGLTAKADRVHFDASGLDELGRRFAAAWVEMMKDQPD